MPAAGPWAGKRTVDKPPFDEIIKERAFRDCRAGGFFRDHYCVCIFFILQGNNVTFSVSAGSHPMNVGTVNN
jgi:hypothetical protein